MSLLLPDPTLGCGLCAVGLGAAAYLGRALADVSIASELKIGKVSQAP
jgi:hypothetical protein